MGDPDGILPTAGRRQESQGQKSASEPLGRRILSPRGSPVSAHLSRISVQETQERQDETSLMRPDALKPDCFDRKWAQQCI